ncbi:tetraacyldisaccharide 4'-kinase [Dyadobacter sp. Leaf189]|uniref:tetraacyldisaccharide 4'-kinase n=1 Tax=Dyadobacter sp. Leaf189 TaxID=1736295 RepID=UPI0006FA93AB|nr:tetraacyldisaccharide 4'-kinase [Dyadobacter sp. Leaf189]KQS33911.1 tetraacyldisaccharide 4'-kinase [Dyadobacter sp. Leaf189]
MKDHQWLKVALIPFSWVYGLVTRVRNLLYDLGWFRSNKASQIIISIGNLTVGGTGKTPVTEYLTNVLALSPPPAILSRGYGRQTRGFVLASHQSTAADIGDEPLQFFQKFSNKGVVVAVSENRTAGAARLAELYPETRLILLDDAFQHRAIRRDINILLNDFNRPFYKDHPFPAGRLRENRDGAKRADVVIVTKCPVELDNFAKEQISREIAHYAGKEKPVFFSFTDYAAPTDFNGAAVQLKNVKIVAGIADPTPFIRYIDIHFTVLDTVSFPDHHNYTLAEVEGLIKYLKNDTFVLTTEKDMVKLKPLVRQLGCADRFAYIPVTVNFGTDNTRFVQWFTTRVEALQTSTAR